MNNMTSMNITTNTMPTLSNCTEAYNDNALPTDIN